MIAAGAALALLVAQPGGEAGAAGAKAAEAGAGKPVRGGAAKPWGGGEEGPRVAGAAGPAFTVKIDNRCPRELSARFILPSDAPASAWTDTIARAPAESLPPHTIVTRTMRAGERMMIFEGRHSLAAWFDTAKEGRGGVIEIHESCDGVTVTNGSTHRRPRSKRRG